ncbi:hypothetical protein NEH83_04105 [Streptomyces sp. JUS-F4]|uniref:hypothetical protein n=1 Tax=unclassified Streptomyces TaxID=2593676 RepID=UPI001C4F91A8|nr:MULTISPECIES: hypothetical protein [unclassified Streptomyces]QXQ95626.1 hypothetical protein KV381_04245 [Streptomyces sp. WY228]WKN13458.1 hypothetical protein NEH83_04105 [Streptomyces sp. JUS-F4]
MVEQQEASGDAVMTRIGQAIMLLHGGDREEARNRFGALWSELGADGDALHRCTLAHYMADTQDDPGDELAWDLRALTAAEGLRAAEAGGAGTGTAEGAGASDVPGGAEGADGGPVAEHPDIPAVRAFYPSLHLNLAADYLKLQRPESARIHLQRARAAAESLADDGYGGGVRAAIDRLELRMREQ